MTSADDAAATVTIATALVASASTAQPLSRRAARERALAEAATAFVVETVQTAAQPIVAETVGPEPISRSGSIEDKAAEPVTEADAFTAASESFRIVADVTRGAADDVPVSDAPDEQSPPAEDAPSVADAAHVAPRRARGGMTRKFIAAGATLSIMGIAGLLAVSTTLPAEAVAAAQGVQGQSAASLVASASLGSTATGSDEEIQAYVASSDVHNDSIQRTEDFSTISLADVAAEQGIRFSDTLYTNDPTAAIQWPFVVGVAMSSGYGERNGQLHAGIDLVPGEGAPIQAIADGTVRIATESGGAYGVTVYIDHVIDGQVVTSHYSHMQYGSLRVAAGDTVKVGDIVGLVGNTGRSYGAHLHFEIIINGSTIDPLPWLQENAGRTSY